MTDLLERLEAMGRTGGVIALLGGAVLLAAAIGAGVWTLTVDPEEMGRWGTGGVRFAAMLLGALGLVYVMVGARLLTRKQYPSAAEIFPPMPVDEFIVAVREHTGEISVCTHCRVQVPTAFSTGSCPVCGSSVEYFEVRDDEDAKMVISAVS